MNKRQEKYLLIAVVVIVAALLLSFTVVGKAKKVNLGKPAPPLIPNDPYGTGQTPSSSSPMDNLYNPTAAAITAAKAAYDGALSYFGNGQPATPPAADTTGVTPVVNSAGVTLTPEQSTAYNMAILSGNLDLANSILTAPDTAGVTPVVNRTGVTLTPKQSTAYNMAILSGNFDLANSILNFPGMPAPGYNP